MRYHQSNQLKNFNRTTVLQKITDKYNYSMIDFPTTDDDIYEFERQNEVCIFVYSLSEDNNIIVDKQGLIEYIHNDLIYLLRVTEGENSHYIYIKNVLHFINFVKCSKDKDKSFCPICQKKVKNDKYKQHIDICRNFIKFIIFFN
jgi:hypothetical protein